MDKIKDFLQKQRWFRSKDKIIKEIFIQEKIILSQYEILFLKVIYENTYEIYLTAFKRENNLYIIKDAFLEQEFLEIFLEKFFSNTQKINNIKIISTEQTNTCIIFNDGSSKLLLKLLRKIEEEDSPEKEFLEALNTKEQDKKISPQIISEIKYNNYFLGTIQSFEENEGNLWELITKVNNNKILKKLGAITSKLHKKSFKNSNKIKGFESEVVSEQDIIIWKQNYQILFNLAFVLIKKYNEDFSANLDLEKISMLKDKDKILDILKQEKIYKIRIHGDYHLGQILENNQNLKIIDFEGEPIRTIQARKAKYLVFKDLAGMLRSFDYAEKYYKISINSKVFLDSYFENCEIDCKFLLESMDLNMQILEFFKIEKALYEFIYEFKNRKDWVHIPLSAISA